MKSWCKPGMHLRAKVAVLAVDAYESSTKQAVEKYDLQDYEDPETYGI
jgi:hypothetical protein